MTDLRAYFVDHKGNVCAFDATCRRLVVRGNLLPGARLLGIAKQRMLKTLHVEQRTGDALNAILESTVDEYSELFVHVTGGSRVEGRRKVRAKRGEVACVVVLLLARAGSAAVRQHPRVVTNI